MIIDIHGHYTTEPPALKTFRERQLAGIGDAAGTPDLGVSDAELIESVGPQLRLQKERGRDLTVFSTRASGMAHHLGTEEIGQQWARVCNDLIHRICTLLPDNFAAVGQLPQFSGAPIERSIPELERIVNELGFVGVNLSPDPSGGYWKSPPLTDRYWYPIYEKMCELDVPAMIHVSSSCNPVFHATGAHYINADTTAFMQFLTSDLFRDFPTLKFVIPHGGGAVPYHWGRYRGLAQDLERPLLKDHLLNNVFFDTCIYHLPGIDLLLKVIPVENIIFGSEMVGAVRGIDPQTGQYFDDTKRYVDALSLSDADRYKIFEGNARRVFPRLDAKLVR